MVVHVPAFGWLGAFEVDFPVSQIFSVAKQRAKDWISVHPWKAAVSVVNVLDTYFAGLRLDGGCVVFVPPDHATTSVNEGVDVAVSDHGQV
jgi:hypothetical protein